MRRVAAVAATTRDRNQQRQGWLNGLFTTRSPAARHAATTCCARPTWCVWAWPARWRSYRLHTHDGATRRWTRSTTPVSPPASPQPGEVVNYVENHDNQTCSTSTPSSCPPHLRRRPRPRAGAGPGADSFSQGIAYFHAGIEMLRSKSMDRNSYDSGDWFNRLDWRFEDNHWGSGLPPKQDNAELWPLLQPLLADPAIKPTPAQIRFTRDAGAFLATC
jgi:pullulanase